MVNDPIADLLIQIKNGYLSKKKEVSIPHSKLKEKLAEILSQEKFVGSTKATEDNGRKMIRITLNYTGSEAAMTHVVRVSKPGRRVYMPIGDIKPILGGRGIQVISTSQGLMTDRQAKKANMGGEVLCKIW